MKSWAFIAAGGIVLYGAWRYRQIVAAEGADSSPALSDWLASADSALTGYSSDVVEAFNSVGYSVKERLGLWHPPEKYAALIAAAESKYDLPVDLLARLLWQESRYREDIITGAVRSRVGAVGIAQFMPATAAEMGIDPLNVEQSIDAAAKYLRRLYGSLQVWDKAIAAYNWGIGNVQRKGLAMAPLETRNYYTSIMADIGLRA